MFGKFKIWLLKGRNKVSYRCRNVFYVWNIGPTWEGIILKELKCNYG